MRQRQALDSAVDKFAGKSGGGGKARGGVKSQKDRALKELVKTGKGVSVKVRTDRSVLRLLTSLSRLGHRRRERFGQETSRQRSAQRIRLSELDAQAVVVDSTSYTTYRVSSGCMYSFDRLYENNSRPNRCLSYYTWYSIHLQTSCNQTRRPSRSPLSTSPPQGLRVLEDGQVEITRLAIDPGQPLIVRVDLFPSSHGEPLQVPRYFKRLVQVLIDFVLELVVGSGSFELVPAPRLFPRGHGTRLGGILPHGPVGGGVESAVRILNVGTGFFPVVSFAKMTLHELLLLSIQFGFL